MKKFKCVVTKTYEYEIEIDENVHTEEKLKNWSKYFCEVENLAEFAGELALRKTTLIEVNLLKGLVYLISTVEYHMYIKIMRIL